MANVCVELHDVNNEERRDKMRRQGSWAGGEGVKKGEGSING